MQKILIVLLATVLCLQPCLAGAGDLFTIATSYKTPDGYPPLPPETPVVSINSQVFRQLQQTMPVGSSTMLDLWTQHGKTLSAQLTRFSVIKPNAPLIAKSAHAESPLPAPQSLLLRGTVVGSPESVVLLAVYPHAIYGRVELGGNTYHVCTLPTQQGADALNQLSVTFCVVTSPFAENPAWMCETAESASLRKPRVSGAKHANKVQATMQTIEVALEGDSDYYTDNGSDETTATEYAEAVFAAVSDIYSRDLNTTLEISSFTLWTSADPYTGTSASSMLSQLRNYWKANHAGVSRTIAHLYSGVNGIGGVAYIDGLCSKDNGYSVAGLNSTYKYPRTTYAWDTDVTAHEIGHNVGSPHTHSCSWNPPIDSCYTSEGGCFTQTVDRRGTIMSYCHLTNQGTELKFHPKVIDLMTDYIADAACMPQGVSLTANAGSDDTVCGGTTLNFEGSASGGVEPYMVRWTPSAGMTGDTTFTPSVKATATTTYVLTVTDADSNVVTDSVTITVNPEIVLTAADTVEVCKGSAVTLTVAVSGGSGLKSYTWNVDGTLTTTSVNSHTFTPTASSLVKVLVTDAKECNANESIYVRLNNVPVLTLTAPTDTICADAWSVLRTKITGGTAPFTYEWKTKDGIISTQPDSLVVSPDSNTAYSLKITDAKGCSDTSLVTVLVHNIKMALSTDHISLPKLGACQTTEDVWITVFNNGDVPFVIEEVKGKIVTTVSKDFPVTIPPNSSHLLPLKLILPNITPITDTLIFAETLCKKPFRVSLSANRGSIEAMQQADPNGLPTALACVKAASVVIPVVVNNNATKAATITKAVSAMGAVIQIAGAPVVVGAQSSTTLQVTVTAPIQSALNADTLVFTYTSEECSSNIGAAISFNGIGTQLQLPAEVEFTDSVTSALEDVTKEIQITPTISGADSVKVADVVVSGPFSTNLTTGAVLNTGVPTAVAVTFHPSQMQADGQATGTLLFTLQDCADSYTIPLKAQRTVVSVADDVVGGLPTCKVVGGILTTNPATVGVTMYDVNGAVVAKKAIGMDTPVALRWIAAGVYVAVLQEQSGRVTAVTLLLTN